LAQLFDEAEASGAVLFFDEADALFGKRTEVRDARDRYANVEVGYLLQRMEQYEGITILATNRMRDLDEAFVRRFHLIVHFPMPNDADRLRIWEGMFPESSKRAADLELATLAKEFEISGGEIRNAVLVAAYLAAAEGQAIAMKHLKQRATSGLLPSESFRVPKQCLNRAPSWRCVNWLDANGHAENGGDRRHK